MITATINTPKYFSAGLYSIHSLPSLYPCLRLPQFRCRTLNLVLLNYMFFVWAHLLMLSFWRTSFPSSMSTASLSLVSFIKLVRVSVADRDVSLNTVPGGKQLVINFHMDMEPLMTTLWVQPPSQFIIHQVTHQSYPCLFNWETRISCGTAPHGLHRSS